MYEFQHMDNSRNNIKTDVLWKFEFYSYMFYLIPILYYIYSFKDVFNLSWLSSIFKTLVSLVLSSAIIFVSLLLTTIIYLSIYTDVFMPKIWMKYYLKAFILQSGSIHGGHYMCFVYDKENNIWYCCNDSTISRVDSIDRHITRAYVFLYSL